MYLDENGEPVRRASLSGPLAAGIPGLPAALEHIANRYGRLPLAQSLAPAIRLAREGLPVTEGSQRLLRAFPRMGSPSPAFIEIFMPDGEARRRRPDPPAGPGRYSRNPERSRRGGLLHRSQAKLLVKGVRDAGGIWSMDDLAAYRIVERQPVRFRYGDVEVTTAPPPSAGGVALAQVFNMLGHRSYPQLEDPARTHLLVEAIRRAYRDRAEFLGDPDFVPVPVERLIHPWYADGLLASVRMDRATPSDTLPGRSASGPSGPTPAISPCWTGRQPRAVTQTINTLFGSGFVPPGTGVILNNEMDDFSVKRGTPNAFGLVHSHANGIEPGKRMLSSMTPTFLESERGLAILGTPGGSRIVTMVLLGALAWMEGADAEGIVGLPRVHHQYIPDSVSFEAGAMDENLQAALAELGHTLRESSRPWGNMQAITLEYADSTLTAASDPRRNGGSDVR